MWYAFRMDSFITSAKTRKELIANLYVEQYQIKKISGGAYELITPYGDSLTYYLFDSIAKALDNGFETQWKEHLELEAFTKFLNDIESVVEKQGWNIDMYENLSDDKDYPRVVITFGHAIGYDSQFRKF